MIGIQFQRPFNGKTPAIQTLPGQAVNQIQAHLFKAGGPRLVDGPDDLQMRMAPSQQRQFFRPGRLHAKTDAVEPGLPEAAQIVTVHCSRVGFQGDLGVNRQFKSLPNGLKQTVVTFQWDQRWGAAAEIHRVCRQKPACGLLHPPDFAQQGIQVSRN